MRARALERDYVGRVRVGGVRAARRAGSSVLVLVFVVVFVDLRDPFIKGGGGVCEGNL